MPLLVGHALVGAGVAVAFSEATASDQDRRRLMMAGAVVGFLPDLDLILTWVLGMGIRWHGDFTHSILFSVVSGYVAARFLSALARMSFMRCWLALSGAMVSHGVLDWLSKKSYGGAALFWPLTSKQYRLGAFEYFAFYPDSKLDPIWRLALRALEINFYELIIFGAFFLMILAMRRSWDGVVTVEAQR